MLVLAGLLPSLAAAQVDDAADAPIGEGRTPLDSEAEGEGIQPRLGEPVREARPVPTPGEPGAALTVNEPMYFVVGGRGDTRARFQFSLKYRIFAEDGLVVDWVPWLEDLHFGYTQTALWNLSEDSEPFEDTSYRPGFFWDMTPELGGIVPDIARFGYEHESNGQAGVESRSLDTLFVQPGWVWQVFDRPLTFAPKLYGYIDRDEQNRDIADFRGYADIIVRYGSEDGLLGQIMLRQGAAADRQTLQLDLSYPIRRPIFARTGGYLYLQVFDGYGESLATYNRETGPQVRIGFAIVR
ncbi:phospholipase A [Spiribacter halobius]|nr:phospholipase A [Spiribacter halobius]UEX79887.1 phospholipase A [Spiribacter halobius]